LQATERELEKIVLRTQRAKRPLRGKDKIGVAVGKVVNRYKMGKHFLLEITEEGFSYWRDEERIRKEAALDGVYVIRTSVHDGEFAPEEAVRAYKDLALVERAFRCLKGVDLRARPVGHWRERRVRAHLPGHAGLLRGVAHAAGTGAVAVFRGGEGGGGGAAHLGGGAGPAVPGRSA